MSAEAAWEELRRVAEELVADWSSRKPDRLRLEAALAATRGEPPEPAGYRLRAYADGHRDGVKCGQESAGFGFVECEHVGRFAAQPSRLAAAAKAYLDAHGCPGECPERDALEAAL